jgi:hypothetical protein
MRGRDLGRQVADGAGRAGILQQNRERVRRRDGSGVARRHGDDLPAQWGRARAQHGDGLRVQVGGDGHHVRLRAADGMRHRHRLGRRRRLVQQRGIGDRQPGEFGDQCLKIDQGFQAALRDFGLVRRVGFPARSAESPAA